MSRDSLAEQAASWVPPWQRQPTGPQSAGGEQGTAPGQAAGQPTGPQSAGGGQGSGGAATDDGERADTPNTPDVPDQSTLSSEAATPDQHAVPEPDEHAVPEGQPDGPDMPDQRHRGDDPGEAGAAWRRSGRDAGPPHAAPDGPPDDATPSPGVRPDGDPGERAAAEAPPVTGPATEPDEPAAASLTDTASSWTRPDGAPAGEDVPAVAPEVHGGADATAAIPTDPVTAATPARAVQASDEPVAGADPAMGIPSEQAAAAAVTASGPTGDALDDPAELHAALEAILLVVDEPATEQTLAQALDQPVGRIAAALREMAGEYTAQRRGFDLRRAAGGWRMYTRVEYAAYVERFVLDGQQLRLTQAALETLAVVAYKQPVSRSRISAIRGVNCDGVVRTLVTRGLIEECGIEPETGARLYATTRLFLEKLGMDAVTELPPLAPFLPEDVDEVADAQP